MFCLSGFIHFDQMRKKHVQKIIDWTITVKSPACFLLANNNTIEPSHDKTNKMTVRPAKTPISLGIHPVWSESSLCTLWVAKDSSFLHADSEDFDQTGRMPRLIWIFAGRTYHFVGFVMRWLTCTNNTSVVTYSQHIKKSSLLSWKLDDN